MRTMLQKLTDEQKYRLVLFAILCVSTLVALGTWYLRVRYSSETRFAFLIWNLFLAWIPLGFAWLAYTTHKLPRRLMYLLMLGCGFLWLLFLPNAPYILTDLMHLARNRNTVVPPWYDVIMLVWFAWNGLLLGLVSMWLMHAALNRIFKPWVGWLFIASTSVLSGFGIYLGRFLRWNSWDIVSDPASLASDILSPIIYPEENLRTLVFTALFGLFLFLAYSTLQVFGNLVGATRATNERFSPTPGEGTPPD